MEALLPVGMLLLGGSLGAVLAWALVGKSAASGQARLEEFRSQLAESKRMLEKTTAQLTEERENAIALKTQHQALQERLAKHQQDYEAMSKQTQLQFENLANSILEKKQKSFHEQSQKGLMDILGPFKERFMEFQKTIDESFGKQAKEQFALKSEIERIVKVNESMVLQTDSLTKALKGDVKAQGNWGEIMLEKILQDSGLTKDVDYILQGSGMGLKHVDGGQMQKPDVVVNLPEDKHIIIDAKVSLTHYERYCAEEDELARAGHLKQYIQSVKAHINGLEQRRYQDNDKFGTPDFVLMFMPIEGAYSLAIQTDRELHSYAWDKKIVVVCPATLFTTLRTVASIWRVELQNRNTIEIAKKGGALYDKIAGLVEDMQKIGTQLDTVHRSYDGAMGKLATGRGNMLSRAEELKALGAKTSKKMPNALMNQLDEEGEAEEEAPRALLEMVAKAP